MIYLIGVAPRVGKSVLAQQVSARLKVGWISTDLLLDLLRVKHETGVKIEWDATSHAILSNAEWFSPYLERFVWGISSMAEPYVIEGVDFLPEQIMRLSEQFQLRVVFLGCSRMTLERLDQFPGCSRGYSRLPEAMRRQIAQDVPHWSMFIQQEAARFGHPYIDMADDFLQRLYEAETLLTKTDHLAM